MIQLKKLFQISNAHFWLSLAGIVIVTLVLVVRRDYIRNENAKIKTEEKKYTWSSRSLLFQSFADLALEHLVTTRPPEHTLPLGYIAEKLKEIKEEGILRLGGDDDPLVAHRRLMLTLRQWRMTRQAWKHLPGLTGYIYNPYDVNKNITFAPAPYKHRQEFLDEIAEYNEHNTRQPKVLPDDWKSSKTKLSDYSQSQKFIESLYDTIQGKMYDDRDYNGKRKISSYEKISAYSSKSTEVIDRSDEFYFLDTFEYMDLLYRNLSRAGPRDLRFQKLQRALKFKSENAPSRQLVLDKQHMQILLDHLKQKDHKSFTKLTNDSLDISVGKAFLLLKNKLKTTGKKNNTDNFKIGNSNKSDESINFIKWNQSINAINNYTLMNQQNLSLVINRTFESSKNYSMVNLKNKLSLNSTVHSQQVNNSYLSNNGFINKRESIKNSWSTNDKKLFRTFTKGLFTRRIGITIRPYTRKRYTIRQFRTYASVRSFKIFRTYTATLSKRQKFKRTTRKNLSLKYYKQFSARSFNWSNAKMNDLKKETGRHFKNKNLNILGKKYFLDKTKIKFLHQNVFATKSKKLKSKYRKEFEHINSNTNKMPLFKNRKTKIKFHKMFTPLKTKHLIGKYKYDSNFIFHTKYTKKRNGNFLDKKINQKRFLGKKINQIFRKKIITKETKINNHLALKTSKKLNEYFLRKLSLKLKQLSKENFKKRKLEKKFKNKLTGIRLSSQKISS